MRGLAVKICGLTRAADRDAAIRAGASWLGFIFYPPSPRSLTPVAAGALVADRPGAAEAVGVFVDPDDAWLDAVLASAPLDILQLHGKETPERVAAIRARTGRRVMKALSVADAADLDRHRAYVDVADLLLFDAKPPRTPGAIPGGNGLAFDWRLLAGRTIALPWLLAGGLDETNLSLAVARTGATAVDVSSGVETAPGIKDPAAIARLLAVARDLQPITA
ncbi:MAG: phosphoribosylanthranilate isomerase [Geminicoccaceae bacterium]